MTDKYFSSVEMNRSNESILVAADIENNEVAYLVSGRESGSQRREVIKFRPLNNLKPSSKCLFAVWMLCPKKA